jgi:hypothetical protein
MEYHAQIDDKLRYSFPICVFLFNKTKGYLSLPTVGIKLANYKSKDNICFIAAQNINLSRYQLT